MHLDPIPDVPCRFIRRLASAGASVKRDVRSLAHAKCMAENDELQLGLLTS